jgi:hypothetical protein
MERLTSVFLLYMMIMMIIAFMLRPLIGSPLYYVILIMLAMLVFILFLESSSLPGPMPNPSWKPIEGEPLPEPTLPVAPQPLIVNTHSQASGGHDGLYT